MKIDSEVFNQTIEELYFSDLDQYKNLTRSRELWQFIIKDASNTLMSKVIEKRVIRDEYEYVYLSLFNSLLILIKDIKEDTNFHDIESYTFWIKDICKEALNFRKDKQYTSQLEISNIFLKIPSYKLEDFYLLLQHIWILPNPVNELFITKLENFSEFPLLSEILDVFNPISIQRELDLIGDRGVYAREELITSLLPYIKWHAHKYRGQGIEYLDLIQTGSMGLIRAIDKFDPTELTRFKTYAYYWIRQAITRSIADHSRIIRLPVHLHSTVEIVKREYYQYSENHGREPTILELSSLCDESVNDIIRILKIIRKPYSIDELELCESHMMDRLESSYYSIYPSCINCSRRSSSDFYDNNHLISNRDEPICLNKQTVNQRLLGSVQLSLLENFFSEDFSSNQLDRIQLNDQKKFVEDFLKSIKPRSRKIFEFRHGWDGIEDLTLEEIGEYYGITRERVRQIESEVIRKLNQWIKYNLK